MMSRQTPKINLPPQISDNKMASALAHGVRNPLNAIKGATVYLKDRYGSDKTLLEFTNIMEEEIDRINDFITKFLSDMACTAAELSRADINALLREVEVFTSFQADAWDISATYEYGALPPVMIDSFQLRHAVLNIVNNALEAMQLGGQLCVKSLVERRDDRLHAVIEISDTGPGMAESKGKDSGQSEAGRGRGYGLNITREVIQSHGGHIEINSRKGHGTTVRLYLPVPDPGGKGKSDEQ